jgi:hypothetical protein
VISNVTGIIIAAAAVIGLVPLGIKAIVDVFRNRKRKKNSEQMGTVALSVLLSLVAPGVLESTFRHVGAVRDALPDWVKAAVPEQPPTTPEAPAPPAAGPEANHRAEQPGSVGAGS